LNVTRGGAEVERQGESMVWHRVLWFMGFEGEMGYWDFYRGLLEINQLWLSQDVEYIYIYIYIYIYAYLLLCVWVSFEVWE
jgi:hypothetical protein